MKDRVCEKSGYSAVQTKSLLVCRIFVNVHGSLSVVITLLIIWILKKYPQRFFFYPVAIKRISFIDKIKSKTVYCLGKFNPTVFVCVRKCAM